MRTAKFQEYTLLCVAAIVNEFHLVFVLISAIVESVGMDVDVDARRC